MNTKTPIINFLKDLRDSFLAHIYAQESNIIGRQRVAVLVYSTMLLVVGIILNLCGIAGPTTLFFQIANISQGVLAVIGFYLYYSRRISLSVAMSFFCIVLQVEISAETVYCTINQSVYSLSLIIANVTLSAVVLLLAIISYLRIIPFVVAILSLGTYAISIYLTRNSELESFFIVFLAVFTALTLMGHSMLRNISHLNRENSELKHERRELLDVFQLTNNELHSYIRLAKEKKLEPTKTAEILTAVGDVAEKQILDNVAHYIRQSSIEFEKLHERLPELSASELEICALILKEKKLKEITELLGKSRSNITCQRTNIRAKLGLQKEDNLHDVLKKRMEIAK